LCFSFASQLGTQLQTEYSPKYYNNEEEAIAVDLPLSAIYVSAHSLNTYLNSNPVTKAIAEAAWEQIKDRDSHFLV
jgi:hypothetical protein